MNENNPRKNQYKALFQTGTIGTLKLKNRLIMGAMGNGLADSDGNINPALLDYYRVRANGGAGMIITQFFSVTPDDLMPTGLFLHDDKFIEGLAGLVRLIHEGGAKACVQLMHPGMLFLLFSSLPKNVTVKVPDIITRLPGDKSYHVISRDDIEQYVQFFADAAVRARAAGADAVEVHACHGCLLSSFLSPVTNRHQDAYGGNTENRTRFLQQVTQSIKQKTGGDFPLIIKINGTDDVNGGVTTPEVVEQARILGKAGADAISISSGMEFWSMLMAPSYVTPEGVMVPVAAEVKKATGLPTIVAGKITPELAAVTVENGEADFVSFGRPILANPEMPNNLAHGKIGNGPECIYCNNCIKSNSRSWGTCTVNPFLYQEANASLQAAPTPKKIMVIGGGLAGMWSALILKKRGHEVSLYEKTDALGGQWNIAAVMQGKEQYQSLTQYLKESLIDQKVPVIMNCEVDKAMVVRQKPDVAVLATGGRPAELSVPVLNKPYVIQVNDVISGKAEVNGKTVVIGGNLLAMEIAVRLAEQGKEVSLVSHSELGGRRGPENKIVFRALLRKLIGLRIPVYASTKILEISGNAVIITLTGEPVAIPADTVVLAVGVKPVDNLINEINEVVPEVYSAGDCLQPGNAAQAAFGAVRWAIKI